jgi:anthranilate phosphoribosyltransferase
VAGGRLADRANDAPLSLARGRSHAGQYVIHPRQFGMQPADLSAIQVKDANESRDMMLSALSGKPGPACDILALNAGAAIYASGVAESHEAGLRKAQEVIAAMANATEQFIAFTGS